MSVAGKLAATPDDRAASHTARKAADDLAGAANKSADDVANAANLAKDNAASLANAEADRIARAGYKTLDESTARKRILEREAASMKAASKSPKREPE